MRKLLGGSRDTSDSLIKSMLFSDESESDISKASLKEINNDSVNPSLDPATRLYGW